MNESSKLTDIAQDDSLPGREKRQRIFSLLAGLEERGPAVAVECIEETDDWVLTDYVVQYLELLPGHVEAKTRVAELLQGKGPLVRSASRLVQWLPNELLDSFVNDYLAEPSTDAPVADVVFTIGIYRPELLRPVADRLADDVQRSLLSGAPDELADAFLSSWTESGALSQLEALALIRTAHASDLIASLRDELADRSDWEVLQELAGRLPDSGRDAGHWPAYMGFVVDAGRSPHVVGGRVTGRVPVCLECEEPAERVLALSAATLPFGLRNDPAFFWYPCDCEAMDSVTVRINLDGLQVYYGPDGPASPEPGLVPGGERALALEKHPNQVGVSLEALPGEAVHQVGGLPRWVDIDRHPRCPECGKTMPFVASVGGGPTPHGELGFEGFLYGFWCDGCRVSSTKFQS
ncbi:hypothetical protein [Streptomyces brasiliensis]|uniref:DUF1963 domain-containing protein n=1 Tax=Streptomyces brasiliensis TaxID=1954 RepID=A0A917KF54_9ACTN|nr:hypothetical protein [Streptomyces brasiliensis]GGJ08280.1 hypothetical protein GCM10010121_018240 [Streptomyces brasiliensis]